MLRVLLVEDSLMDACLTRDHLSSIAIVTIATSLSEAITQAKCTRFDAAILDLGLPDSTGEETIARFLDQVHPIPLLVYSSNPEQLGKYGDWVEATLTKPTDKRTLLDALSAITDRTSASYLKQTTMRLLENLQLVRKMAHG
jgi:CheY-like chemotaxis protein